MLNFTEDIVISNQENVTVFLPNLLMVYLFSFTLKTIKLIQMDSGRR